MLVVATRDSVCMADDYVEDSTHRHTFEFDDDKEIEAILTQIANSDWLPCIHGGAATWSVVSHDLLAIVAQQWDLPRMQRAVMVPERWLKVDGALRLHFNYHAQVDPELVERVLGSFVPKADFSF